MRIKMLPLILAIAKEKNLPLVDIQAHMVGSEKMSVDGVHFNNDGYTKMCKAFRTMLLEQIGSEP